MRNTLATKLLFELSQPGRRAAVLPRSDVPERPLDELIPKSQRAAAPPQVLTSLARDQRDRWEAELSPDVARERLRLILAGLPA